MIPRLRILFNVYQRLQHLETTSTGRLYGTMYNNTLTILTFSIATLDNKEITPDHTVIQLHMPTEIDLCGIVWVGDVQEKLPDAFQDIDITDNPLLLKCSLDNTNIQADFYIHQRLHRVENIEVIAEEDIYNDFTYIRLQASFPFIIRNGNIKEMFLESRKKIASGKVGIWFPSGDTYLFNNAVSSKNICLKKLLSMPVGSKDNVIHWSYFKQASVEGVTDAIEARMFYKVTSDNQSEECAKHAPVLKHIKRTTFNIMEYNLKIDALSLVSQDISSPELYDILVESMCRNIKLIEKYFERHYLDTKLPLTLPEPIHYKPSECGHLFTVVNPSEGDGNNTLQYRENLHAALALKMTRPYFKRENCVKLYSEIKTHVPLINPHVGLSSIKENGPPSIVYGLYEYYHYMHDNFDDNGWGCAYRSLQTIISWYRLQGYTNVPMPTHYKIQQCLVDIQDKPPSFIGSKQWIGSTEVGFVLETLLGVPVKILCAPSGEKLASLHVELAYHFQTQGTPVMIGGGVLAHTILGVSCKENADDAKFLVLDPHYTGTDDMATILKKGWCGWKTKDFWKKDAFYNLCLPQRPQCV